MVDEVRVARLLRSIDEGLASLARREAASPDRRADETWLMAVKYSFITVIEACIDLAQHITSVEHLGTPANNGDAMRRLGRAGVVSPEVADSMAKAVGFRNVLVHEYFEVDDDIVLRRLADHRDLYAFLHQVGEWIQQH